MERFNDLEVSAVSFNFQEQCFSTFFDLRHPSLATEQFGVTPGFNLLLNKHQIQKLAAPLELFTSPKGVAAPRLRTTVLDPVAVTTRSFMNLLTIQECFKPIHNYKKDIFRTIYLKKIILKKLALVTFSRLLENILALCHKLLYETSQLNLT